MINIRIPREEDRRKILNLFNYENIKNRSLENKSIENSMVVYDRDEIVGFSNYVLSQNNEEALIDTVIVKSEYQGSYIGDGLVKALLNLADKRGVKRIYTIVGPNNSKFFEKVGFYRSKIDISENFAQYIEIEKYLEKNSEVFEAILPDFFEKACRSKL